LNRNDYVPSASMIWIRYCGLSAARSSQSRTAGHPVQLLLINITEICELSIQKLIFPNGPIFMIENADRFAFL
jgi:hypothetical protein